MRGEEKKREESRMGMENKRLMGLTALRRLLGKVKVTRDKCCGFIWCQLCKNYLYVVTMFVFRIQLMAR